MTQNNENEPLEPNELPVPDFKEALAALSNPELLSALDLTLLELEKRLLHYSRVGPELLEMADEGLVLAVRARARLGQASLLCSACRRPPADSRGRRVEA